MNSNKQVKSNKSQRPLKPMAWLLLSLIISSCSEDVITIDLNDAEPKIVIEGTLSDLGEPCTVAISKSGDFYKPSVFPPVRGATVTLQDSEGNRETLAENEPGLYRGGSLTGVEGRTYTLTVESDGNRYDAVSTLMEAVEIDSLTYYFEDDPEIFNDDYEDVEEGYVFSCHFTDPETADNYYRFKLTHNGKLFQDYFMFQDRYYGDGEDIEYDFSNWFIFEKNDTMKVELLSIDKAAFDYFFTLSAVLLSENSGPVFSSVPDNPLTNFTGGALGYFAAYSVRSQTVVFEESATGAQ
ncbi:DUF4249 domain-containing protein [Candidatus Latescibacterota bacterium]